MFSSKFRAVSTQFLWLNYESFLKLFLFCNSSKNATPLNFFSQRTFFFFLNHYFDFYTKNLIFRSEVEKHSFVNPHVQFLVCLQHIKISEMAESEQFEKKMKYACFLNIFYWKFWTPLVAEPKMGDHQKHLLFDRLLDGSCLDTKKDHSNYCSFPDLKRAIIIFFIGRNCKNIVDSIK